VEVTTVTIRDATLGDMPSLRLVYRRSSLSNVEDQPVLLAHPDVLELSDAPVREQRVRAATVGDRIVGFAATLDVDGRTELEALFVDPDWMRRGVGRELITDLVRLAKFRGVDRVVVTAGFPARGFYEEVGFQFDGETATPLGPPALRMHLDIG
jgi:GNAT superfamily N-acetyltransferase